MGKQFLDQYSLLHFSQGIIAYFLGTPPFTWFVSHATFEFLENSGPGILLINKYLTFWPGGKPEADSAINILGEDRVKWVHPDCGFWMLPRSVADRKMAALDAGRDLAEGK